MRILITSALFPPDVAAPAAYIKELAARLANQHAPTVLTYGHIPESVANVTIQTIPKSVSAPRRLWQFTRALITLAAHADVVIVHNAPSTELPLLLASMVRRKRWLLLASDSKIQYTGWRKLIHHLALQRVKLLPVALPLPRPEILPFAKPSERDWQEYETSWETHLTALNHFFHE